MCLMLDQFLLWHSSRVCDISCLISLMLQFDKSIHSVVLYEYYLIGIFIKIHANLRNEGKVCKNYKHRESVEVQSILHS